MPHSPIRFLRGNGVVSVVQAPSIGPDEQFDTFRIILDQYLLPTSPDEVNIESKMSKRMASFKTRYDCTVGTTLPSSASREQHCKGFTSSLVTNNRIRPGNLSSFKVAELVCMSRG